MHFRILGPLEVEDGRPESLRLRGHQQRALLALLLRANEVVPVDEIIVTRSQGSAVRECSGMTPER